MCIRRCPRLALISVFHGALLAASASAAVPGVTEETIRFGQSACFSGPNLNLGCQYQQGILAAFDERNRAGGVLGRQLQLVSLDDGYETERAAANARRFAERNDIFAVIGSVGTPTARRIVPILRDAGIPAVGQYTGADFLYNVARYPNVVNLRAGYAEETRLLVDHMVNALGKRRFGIIYQDDAFGRSVLGNYRGALQSHDLFILAKATYTRNTHAFHSALFHLEPADLDAVLLVGSNAVNGELINLINSLERDYVMANLSFVNSGELIKQVEARRERVLVAEVVPRPEDPMLEIARRFRAAVSGSTLALHENCPPGDEPGVASFEGYLLGRFLVSVLERIPSVADLTREKLLETARTGDLVLLDDWPIQFDEDSNAGSRYVRLIDLAGFDSTLGSAAVDEI